MQSAFVMGEKRNWKFLYIFEEKQFYTFNSNGTKGKIYRCANRNCKCRVLINSDEIVTRSNSVAHNHTDDCEQRYKKLQAMEAIKQQCASLSTIASGKRMLKTRDIFKQVIVE